MSGALRLLSGRVPELESGVRSIRLYFAASPFVRKCPRISRVDVTTVQGLGRTNVGYAALAGKLLPVRLTRLSPRGRCKVALVALSRTCQRRVRPKTIPYTSQLTTLETLRRINYGA